jgi:hypothetical protein
MNLRFGVGTSCIAGKRLFAPQHLKKGTRMMQHIGQSIAQAATAERFYHCLSQ